MEVTPQTQLLHFDQCSRPEYRTSGWGCVGGDGGYDEGASLTLDSSVTWKPHAHPGRLSCDRDSGTELDTHEGDGDGDDDGRIPIRHAVAGLDSISCAEEQAGAGSRNRWTEEQEEALDRRAQEAEQEVEGEEEDDDGAEFIADSGSGGDGLMDRSNSVSSTLTSREQSGRLFSFYHVRALTPILRLLRQYLSSLRHPRLASVRVFRQAPFAGLLHRLQHQIVRRRSLVHLLLRTLVRLKRKTAALGLSSRSYRRAYLLPPIRLRNLLSRQAQTIQPLRSLLKVQAGMEVVSVARGEPLLSSDNSKASESRAIML